MTIDKFDYQEPRCFCDTSMYQKEAPVKTIPVGRIIDKLNELYDAERLEEAEKLIRYWIAEAESGHDQRGMFTLSNELMGTCRKLGKEDKAFEAANQTLSLAHVLEIENTVAGATAVLNCGTVCKAFGRPEEALNHYLKCEELYNHLLNAEDSLYGGLYNNLATVYVELNQPEKAIELLTKSLEIVKTMDNNARELEAVKANIEYCKSLIKPQTDETKAEGFINISKQFYEECFKEIIEKDFAEIKQYLAFGICGSGSECFGFDDDISKDHDYEPGFIVFIPGEELVSRQDEFKLQRAYDKLPKEYKGLRRNLVAPVGGKRHGVIRINDFLGDRLGSMDTLSPLTILPIQSNSLAEITNGEIWEDNYGYITKIREFLLDMPNDYRLKRLAGELLIMAQSGQYNFNRCRNHGENGAAALALTEFVKASLEVVFLLNRAYMPYYKWSFKAMDKLKCLSSLKASLEAILLNTADVKEDDVEAICQTIAKTLIQENLSSEEGADLEKHAYSVNSKIKDNGIRDLSIFYGIQ